MGLAKSKGIFFSNPYQACKYLDSVCLSEDEDNLEVEGYEQMWDHSRKRVRIAVLNVEPVSLAKFKSL